MRIYFYKLSADNGGAPHVSKGHLSLAICKPMIRKSAQVRDLIFGFAADSLYEDNRLIYVASITDKLLNGDYYKLRKYKNRWDCIYEWDGTRYVWRVGSFYHRPKNAADQYNLTRDLGNHPVYERASVLISKDFRYFGKNGTDDYKTAYPAIRTAVEKLKQGHRVNHADELHRELLALKDEVWATNVKGMPTTLPKRASYLRGCGGD